jgi:hypothetical protein
VLHTVGREDEKEFMKESDISRKKKDEERREKKTIAGGFSPNLQGIYVKQNNPNPRAAATAQKVIQKREKKDENGIKQNDDGDCLLFFSTQSKSM